MHRSHPYIGGSPAVGRARRALVLLTIALASASAVHAVPATAAPQKGGTAADRPPAPAAPAPPAAVDYRRVTAPASDFDRVAATATADGIRAIANLQVTFTPEGYLGPAGVAAQRAAIVGARDDLLRSLGGTPFVVLRTYESVPAVALRLTAPAFAALRASGKVAAIADDEPLTMALDNSTATIEAKETTQLDRTGAGRVIAVLDTGIEASHPFLQQNGIGPSKVIAEACFLSGGSGNGGPGGCPNGLNTQVGAGAGAPCTYVGCEHGTHVAGIAAGHRTASIPFSGVAPDANLVSIRVMYSGQITSPSDQQAGLGHVYALATTGSNPLKIAAVNISIGGSLAHAVCDSTNLSYKQAIDNLESIGIPTVIAAGNHGSHTGVSEPACISSAITVGATLVPTNGTAESLWASSASSWQVDLLAPGVDITSSVTGGLLSARTGTSSAAPHVAGAWAVLKQVKPVASVAEILFDLQSTGKPITDTVSGLIRPRVRVLAGSVLVGDTGFVEAESYAGGAQLGLVSNGVGLATRAGGPASGPITISGIPSGSTIQAAFLYWMTIGGPDPSVILQGVVRTGTLVGASRNTCWFTVNQQGPNRVYRAAVPASSVPGNGSYTVSGVGGFDGIDGQGASLLVVYKGPVVDPRTKVIRLRHGSMTVNSPYEYMGHSFQNLSVPANPDMVQLNVGVGDGGPDPEGPLWLTANTVTSPNAFSGSDGPSWDDLTIAAPANSLQAGSVVTSNWLTASSYQFADCLAWAYAALSYRTPAPRNQPK